MDRNADVVSFRGASSAMASRASAMSMTSFAVAATLRAPLRGCLAAASSAVSASPASANSCVSRGGGNHISNLGAAPLAASWARRRVVSARTYAHVPSARRFTAAAVPESAADGSFTDRKQRVVFLGTPEVAASALDALLDAADDPNCAFEVHAVVSQPGRPRGRGRSKSGPPPPSPVAETALRRGVPDDRILCPVKANDTEFLDVLTSMQPDLAITAAYGNFLPSKFLSIPRLGTLNIHPSLLPQFRGAAPVQRALERGVDMTGVSVAYTVLEMDAGPVVRRVERDLDGSEKHDELLNELFHTGAKALLHVLPEVWTGEASFEKSTPQAEFGEPSDAPKVSPEEGILTFKTSEAKTLRNKVRGFAGWPGTKGVFAVKKDGEDAWVEVTLKILTAQVATDVADAPADGETVVLTKKSMLVPCLDGTWLEVTEVQPPGKKAMAAGAYANGLKGSVLKVVG